MPRSQKWLCSFIILWFLGALQGLLSFVIGPENYSNLLFGMFFGTLVLAMFCIFRAIYLVEKDRGIPTDNARERDA